MADDYKDTLNLPKTKFPMRANLGAREPERIAHWEKEGLYSAIQKKNAEGDTFILHDGPPYANGDIHLGHALNKILKDIVLRYKSMRGFRTPYIPGWDCHGLPIEQQILKKVGSKIHEMEPSKIRQLCHDYAAKYINLQRDQFTRLGILGEWEKPYTTFDPVYEYGILSVLRDLVARGLVQKGFKCVHWDTVFRTALAEAEIEYHPRESDSIYVRFPLSNTKDYPSLKNLENVSLVIWTTTPWTLPANLGVCLHPKLDYVALEHAGQVSIVAKGLMESFLKNCKIDDAKVVATFLASELERGICAHPIFPDRESLIMLADHVNLEQGTGCVHTAPGHGHDDFEIGKKYGLPVIVPVDNRGRFTDEYPEMEGKDVFDANPEIIKKLEETGILIAADKVTHDYPHSWRSKKPIIFRATEQWFIELEFKELRKKTIDSIDNSVKWIPSWGHNRIRSMVESRPDWCISRQRSWGVPIPAIRSKKSGESILDLRIIENFMELVGTKGTDVWFSQPLNQIIPDGYVYEPTGEDDPDDFEKEYDILDVWFDSGASHVACLEQDSRLSSPANLYLEGSDQHRGWFQAALLTSIGTRDRAPFKEVLTHGFILDSEGIAMSKSEGNVVSPQKLIKTIGADNLRLWIASEDYRNDIKISDEILKRIADTYRLIRNTLRFQISNLFDFDEAENAVVLSDLHPLDKWALHKTAELVNLVTAAYEAYEFHKVYQLCNKFCSVTLSATYHDILKDRLYTFGTDSKDRRSAQTVIKITFDTLKKLLAPILVFTTDEAHAYAQANEDFSPHSIHLESWPLAPADWSYPTESQAVDKMFAIRDGVNEKLESLRMNKEIGQSLDAVVLISGNQNNNDFQLLQEYENYLPELFIVSQVHLKSDEQKNGSLSISAHHAEGDRCPRCWRWLNELKATEDHGEICSRCVEAISRTH